MGRLFNCEMIDKIYSFVFIVFLVFYRGVGCGPLSVDGGPLPSPSSLPPKTFDLIESLFLGSLYERSLFPYGAGSFGMGL